MSGVPTRPYITPQLLYIILYLSIFLSVYLYIIIYIYSERDYTPHLAIPYMPIESSCTLVYNMEDENSIETWNELSSRPGWMTLPCALVPEQVYTNYSSQVTQTLNQYKLQDHCSPLPVWGSTGTTWISSSSLWYPSYKAVLQRSDHLNLLSFAHKMWRSLVWIGRRPPQWQYPRGNVGSECSILHTAFFSTLFSHSHQLHTLAQLDT